MTGSAFMEPTDDELKDRIVEIMGHLPCGDQGQYVMQKLRDGYVWSVRTEGLAIKSMRYFAPTVWQGRI